MGIEITNGGTCFTGKGIGVLRLVALKSALRLESIGMRASRGVNARKLAKQATGLKTNDFAKLMAAVEQLIVKARSETAIVDLRPPPPRECPQCKVAAVVPAPAGVDCSDGTTHVCNPNLGGCDQGFALVGEAVAS